MIWYYVVSSLFSALALIVSLLNFRQNKNTQESKELKERFDNLEVEIKKNLDTSRSENEDLFEMHNALSNKLGVLEERVNNEINASVKYRDKFEAKLDEILRTLYAKK